MKNGVHLILMTEAAEYGDINAQFKLGMCYYKGEGIKKSYVDAYKWFYVARTSATEQDNAACKTTSKVMTAAQIAKAETRARK